MPASAAATAVVHFIGIALFSTHLSNDGHWQVVMPRIPALPSPQPAISAAGTKAVDGIMMSHGIEPHVALIAFRACDYVSVKGWPIRGFERDDSYLYVQLDGDRIELEGGLDETQRPAKSTTMSNVVAQSGDASEDELQLPHLTQRCPAITGLKADFKEPRFRGAAAVVDVPKGSLIWACSANAANVDSSRLDTEAYVPNRGTLTLHSIQPGDKKLVLKGDAHVYVVQMPVSLLDGGSLDPSSMPHSMAYVGMSASGTCGTNVIARHTAAKANRIPVCDASPVVMYPPPPPPPPPPQIFSLMDFQCSNSQWP